MNLPVRSTLPLNTLSPMALRHKFRVSHPGGFAGLGDACIQYDEFDNCIQWDTSIPQDYGSTPIQQTATNWATSNGGVLVPDGSGDVLLPAAGGGYIEISPSGMMTHVAGMPPTPGAGASTSITAAQAQAYASIIGSLTNAGVRIAAITSLSPGQTLLPNGTIVGAGQTIGPGGVNPSFASLLSSPMLLIAGFVVLLIAAEGGR